MQAKELDEKFDNGESVMDYIDLTTLRRPGLETQSINIDFPKWMIVALDKEARRLGVDRQAVVKTWITQQLDVKTACHISPAT